MSRVERRAARCTIAEHKVRQRARATQRAFYREHQWALARQQRQLRRAARPSHQPGEPWSRYLGRRFGHWLGGLAGAATPPRPAAPPPPPVWRGYDRPLFDDPPTAPIPVQR